MLEGNRVFKKRRELQTLLACYDGRITGDQVAAAFNQEVADGAGVGKIRRANLPLTYLEGRLAFSTAHKRNPLARRALDANDRQQVRDEYVRVGSTIYQLAESFGASPYTIYVTVRDLRRGSATY